MTLVTSLDAAGLCGPVYLVGIGGTGMVGLARVLRKMGLPVRGSELRRSQVTDELSTLGIDVWFDQDRGRIPAGTRAVVRTAAAGDEHPEVRAARAMGLPVYRYAEVLGLLMKERRGIAISGTHGKTTTTAMVAHLLRKSGRDPGFVIGGHIPDLGGSAHLGTSDELVVEACEYSRSFLALEPEVAFVLNIELDHPDCFRSIVEVRDAFSGFCGRTREGGVIFANADDPSVRRVARKAGRRVVAFGLGLEATYRGVSVRKNAGRPVFSVVHGKKTCGPFHLAIPGIHNVRNALAVVAFGLETGMAPATIERALRSFSGAARRFQEIRRRPGLVVVDDYAHHPTAVKATLRAARDRYGDARIWAIFQPHQYSRTRVLLDRFAEAFEDADQVIVPDIYSCRDTPQDRVSVDAAQLVRAIRAHGRDARHLPSFELLVRHVNRRAGDDDVVVTMGAGDIHRVASGLAWARG